MLATVWPAALCAVPAMDAAASPCAAADIEIAHGDRVDDSDNIDTKAIAICWRKESFISATLHYRPFLAIGQEENDCIICDTLFRTPVGVHAQRAHLPVEVRALNAERLRRLADAASVLLQHGSDVLALETRARLPQRAAAFQHHRPAAETHV